MMLEINCISRTQQSVAYISASAELRAVMVWRLDDQCSGPCNAMRWPEMDRVLKRSRSCCEVAVVGVDASCGPQLASAAAASMILPLIGKCTKD